MEACRANNMNSEPTEMHCFVDEAGDPVLFSGTGKVLTGWLRTTHRF
jgi:hypothetical protein